MCSSFLRVPTRISDGSFSRTYAFLRLDRRDIEQIFDSVSSGGEPAKILSEGYEYTSVAELVEHFGPRKVKELRFQAGRIRVSIDSKYASVYVGSTSIASANDQALALGLSIDELLKQRQRLLTWTSLFALLVIASSVGIIAFTGWINGRGLSFAIPCVACAAVVVWLQAYKSVIVLQQEHETFLRRHRESVLVSLITAALCFGSQIVYEWATKP